MIDTIRVVVPFGLPQGFDETKWIHRTVDQEDHVGGSRFFQDRAQLRTGMVHEGLRHVRILYNESRSMLSAEFSVARILGGGEHNIHTPTESQLAKVVDIVDGLVRWGLTDGWGRPLVDDLPSILSWRVVRVDLCVNYRPRSAPFDAAKTVLMALKPKSRRMLAVRTGSGTVNVRNRGRRRRREIEVYDKEDQVRSKKRTRPHADLAAGILRLEVRLRGQHVVRGDFSQQGRKGPILLRDVMAPASMQAVLMKNLARLGIEEGMESVETTLEELGARVGPRKARTLWPYIMQRRDKSLHDAAKALGVHEETARRYDREIRAAGLYTAAVSAAGVVEDLVAQVQEATGGGESFGVPPEATEGERPTPTAQVPRIPQVTRA